MKFTVLPLAALAGFALAVPTPTVEDAAPAVNKRASVNDPAFGYASTNGGTTGGAGGATTTVSSLAAFSSAAAASGPAIIVVNGHISGHATIRVASDKTIVGTAGSSLDGVGLYIRKVSNVIVRNLAISNVLAGDGDAIGIDESFNVWVDHVDLSSNLNNGKDYYDGLFDVKHGADWITLSNSRLHDHYKASLIGHSDSNGAEDSGHLHITYANNRWTNVNSRAPSIRFGTAHIYNNYYDSIGDTGVNTRLGAQVLIESSAFVNTDEAIVSDFSDDVGYATVNDVNLGGGTNTAPAGTISKGDIPYSYSLVGSGNANSATSSSGATLSF